MNMRWYQKFIALLKMVEDIGFHYYAKIRRFSQKKFAFHAISLKNYDLKECKVII
jgi:hypothetical protein